MKRGLVNNDLAAAGAVIMEDRVAEAGVAGN
jgi:hypothetical protein